ncbi:hypothetical protein BGZ73_002246 [Actinomortierella ambigua]|nr:hypothetical protein BGZ73_002246 [Actinomortierella ambigua]
MFHEAFGLNDFDTDALEQALLETSAHGYLTDLHSRMLRTLTQNRQISFDNWLVYLRKEFVKRSPEQNPWKDTIDEEPIDYDDFSIETKIMILTNLCEWQLDDPERFRQSLKEDDDLSYEWRVMPIGYDSNDRTYWLFDDNRLYRENPPLPPKASKKKAPVAAPVKSTKPAPRQGTRRSTRGQKDAAEPEPEPELEFVPPPTTEGVDWEPLCVTRQEWEEFAVVFKRSKHPAEKALYTLVNNDILPKVVEDLMAKEKERQKLEAVANRKRSSRIVIRELEIQEKARLEAIRQQELAEAAERRKQELRERREERERQQQHHLREQRLKEREDRLKARENSLRQQHERKRQHLMKEAKAREERMNRRLNGSSAKDSSEGTSTREQSQDVEEEEDWVFDCVCGVFGTNLDDGELMIACNKCNVWQHVACLKQDYAVQGKKEVDWEKVDFVCQRCLKKAEDRKRRREQKKLNGATSASSRDSSMEIRTPQANGMDVDMKPIKSQPMQPPVHSLPSNTSIPYQQHVVPIVSAVHPLDGTRAVQHPLPSSTPIQPTQPYPPQPMPYQSYQPITQYPKPQTLPPPQNLQPYPSHHTQGPTASFDHPHHQQQHQLPVHATSMGHSAHNRQPMVYASPYPSQHQQPPFHPGYPVSHAHMQPPSQHGYPPAQGPAQSYQPAYPGTYTPSQHAVNGHGLQKPQPPAAAPVPGWNYPSSQPYRQQDS